MHNHYEDIHQWKNTEFRGRPQKIVGHILSVSWQTGIHIFQAWTQIVAFRSRACPCSHSWPDPKSYLIQFRVLTHRARSYVTILRLLTLLHLLIPVCKGIIAQLLGSHIGIFAFGKGRGIAAE